MVQHSLENISLTSAEIGQLWSTYLAESMSKCMLSYFVAKSKDPDIHSVLQYSLDKSIQHVNTITEIFNKSNFPIPHGFNDEDFDVNAKQLFSETFMLSYSRFAHKHAMINFAMAFSMSSRSDVCDFFDSGINSSKEIYKKANDILLSKGLFVRAPYIPIPDRVEWIHGESWYNDIFGEKRPINAIEIGHVFSSSYSKSLERTMLLGLNQVANSKKLKEYLSKGKKVCDKQIEVLSSFLKDEDIIEPFSYDNQVTDSTESPFSDKLILFHTTIFGTFSITGFGQSLASCGRKDLVMSYSRIMAELLLYAKDGADLMIEFGWLERVPEAANRTELKQ